MPGENVTHSAWVDVADCRDAGVTGSTDVGDVDETADVDRPTCMARAGRACAGATADFGSGDTRVQDDSSVALKDQ